MDASREDSLTKHVTSGIHDVACSKHICASAKFVLAPGYEQREERRKAKEKEAKGRMDKNRKHEYIAQKWDSERAQNIGKRSRSWNKVTVRLSVRICRLPFLPS